MQSAALAQLPLGIQTFAKVREGGFVYVDKTPQAIDLAKTAGIYFLARPRRFGKSLFLDTLRNLFEGRRELFTGLHAEGNWEWDVKYPVIKLDMSGIFNKPADLESRLYGLLENNAIKLGVDLRGQDVPTQFQNLMMDASHRHGQKTVLLIDEYDDLELAEQMHKKLRGFYSIIKAADEHLRFVMLTGVSKFSKVSIFSGLNNLKDISLNPKYASICGYTEADLNQVFSKHLEGVDRKQLQQWYNGYNFLGTDLVYNPYDILNFIDRSQSFGRPRFRSYWFETGTPAFVVDLIARDKLSAYQVEPSRAHVDILDSCPINKLELTTVLFQSGYLTIDPADSRANPDAETYKLVCPNHSVRSALQLNLFRHYTGNSDASHQDDMLQALRNAELDNIESRLKRLFASIAADNYRNNDIARFEGHYASVVYSFFAGMNLTVIAEDASSRGRVDLSIQLGNNTYIIEFKVVKRKSKNNSALQQIIQRGYAAKYAGAVYQIGIEFSETRRNIVGFAWQQA